MRPMTFVPLALVALMVTGFAGYEGGAALQRGFDNGWVWHAIALSAFARANRATDVLQQANETTAAWQDLYQRKLASCPST